MTSSSGHNASGGGASGPVPGTFTTTTLSMENCSLAAATSLCELANSVKERHGMWIFGETESKRRVIIIEKKNGSYGFTLQSYFLRYKKGWTMESEYKQDRNRETDFITYVNAVEKDGAAYAAGLREGDVILSINGQNMARVEHKSLVSYIRKCPMHLKMVVVSDERARKVELHMRYVHLQKKLQDKMRELENLQRQEREILSGEADTSLRRNNSPSPLAGPCIAAAAKACCFCPPSKAEKLEAKEKSKSIGSTTERLMHGKENILYYDCYRKSQSTRELHKEQSSSCGKLTNSTKKASSGGDIITLSSSANSNSILSSNSMTKVNSTTTTQQPQPQQHRPGCFHNLTGNGGGGGIPIGNSSANSPNVPTPPSYSLNSPQQPPTSSIISANGGSVAGVTSSGASSGCVSDGTQKCGSTTKPKSWDNLLGTKSFGGYGFGFGYGYFPQRTPGPEGGNHYHFTHPHHHNHHTHCSGHFHSNYYYKQNKSQQSPGAPVVNMPPGSSAPTSVVPTSVPYSATSGTACTASHHRYHAYPTRVPVSHGGGIGGASAGAPHYTLRSPFGVPSSSHSSNTNQAANCRTLPLLKPSASRSSENTSGISPKMEKTLSDSSLNSEHHKDFPKAMSYFRGNENEETRYSSEDEYDQYGAESTYDGKRIFV